MSSSTIWASIGLAADWQQFAAIKLLGPLSSAARNGSRNKWLAFRGQPRGRWNGRGPSLAPLLPLAPSIRRFAYTNWRRSKRARGRRAPGFPSTTSRKIKPSKTSSLFPAKIMASALPLSLQMVFSKFSWQKTLWNWRNGARIIVCRWASSVWAVFPGAKTWWNNRKRLLRWGVRIWKHRLKRCSMAWRYSKTL